MPDLLKKLEAFAVLPFSIYQQHCQDEIKKKNIQGVWDLCEKMFYYYREHGYQVRPGKKSVVD